MSENENLQLAKEAIAAINAHDIDRYVQNLDSSFVSESETMGKVHGAEGARKMFAAYFEAFPDLRYEPETLTASGDTVFAQVVLSGTHQGAFAGIPPTNKKVAWHACTVVQLRNGKAIHARTYADNISLMRQLGVLPAPKTTTA
jgi:steroid delta-isomerase-like uncharacterized protein